MTMSTKKKPARNRAHPAKGSVKLQRQEQVREKLLKDALAKPGVREAMEVFNASNQVHVAILGAFPQAPEAVVLTADRSH